MVVVLVEIARAPADARVATAVFRVNERAANMPSIVPDTLSWPLRSPTEAQAHSD